MRREDTKSNATLPVDRSPVVVDIPLIDVCSAILLIQSTTNQPLLFQIEWIMVEGDRMCNDNYDEGKDNSSNKLVLTTTPI